MMSERSGIALAAMTLEEPGSEQSSPRGGGPGGGGPLRCGPCAVWPRQQTWLCAVPLVMGFVGLGLSLMLLKWIVVGSVQDYVPTDLVDPKGSIGQDPIFLSKPSAVPKGPVDVPDSTAPSSTTTTAMVSTTTPLAADGTAPAPRTRLLGPPANHSANGSAGANGDGRVPHLHNHVGTRVSETGPSSSGAGGATATTTTTRAARVTPPPGAKDATPRSAVKKGSGAGGIGRNGASSSKSGQTSTATTTASSTTAATKTTTKVQPPTSPPSPAAKPTSRWNHGRSAKGPATRPHHRYRTPVAPTTPSPRSEVFKPCVEDKDLAFCLNEGECSIIETVAGVHRHCRCKEGYHGLRCDQFVPKTDAILSDPTDELGIEFMESGETYQRQVLSIFSIASGICLLGVACMALYRRNKRHREKLQAHFSESRMLRDCSISTSGLMSKSTPRLQYSLQAHKSCGYHGTSSTAGMVATGTSTVAPPAVTRALSKGKRLRSSSLSLSPAPKPRETNHFRTPPIPRGKHLVGGCRVTGHVYKHLQEVESADVEAEYLNRCCTSGDVTDLTSAMQSPNAATAAAAGRTGWTEVPCTRLDKGTAAPLPSLRTRSVPIIPSLQPRDRMDERPVGVPNPAAAAATAPPRLQWRSALPARKTTAVPVGSSAASSGPSETAVTAVTRPALVGTLRSGGKSRCTPARENPCPVETAVELEGGSKHRSLCGPTMGSAGPCSDLLCGGMNTVTAVTTVLAQEGGADKYTRGAPFPGAEATVLKAVDQTEAPGPCQAETTVAHGGANCASSATNKAPGGRERGKATASSAAPSSSSTS